MSDTKKKEVQIKIRGMLESTGWKIVEEDFKAEMKMAYAQLLDCKPKKLEDVQRDIKARLSTVQRMYQLAGLEWAWDKYKDLSTVIGEETLTKEAQLLNEYLLDREGVKDA